jgi:hypothetical protein
MSVLGTKKRHRYLMTSRLLVAHSGRRSDFCYGSILLKNSENERRQKIRLWSCRADRATRCHRQFATLAPHGKVSLSAKPLALSSRSPPAASRIVIAAKNRVFQQYRSEAEIQTGTLPMTSRRRLRARYCFAAIGRASPLAYLASKLRLKLAAAPALSITIKSLSCRLSPDAEKFAAPVRSNLPSI